MPHLRIVLVFGFLWLVGCRGRSAPNLEISGAYFPDWLLFGLLGLVFAALIRLFMIKTKLHLILPYQFFLCSSLGMALAALFWLL
jgi:YtcA family